MTLQKLVDIVVSVLVRRGVDQLINRLFAAWPRGRGAVPPPPEAPPSAQPPATEARALAKKARATARITRRLGR